jgi:hypothetical protein
MTTKDSINGTYNADWHNSEAPPAGDPTPGPKRPEYKPKDAGQVLAYFVEECGEVLAAAGKTQRWGWLSSNPELPPEERETNAAWIGRELGDLLVAADMLSAVLLGMGVAVVAPTASREVDEAAVRASEREAIAAWVVREAAQHPGTSSADLLVSIAECIRVKTSLVFVRPAASGKEQGE